VYCVSCFAPPHTVVLLYVNFFFYSTSVPVCSDFYHFCISTTIVCLVNTEPIAKMSNIMPLIGVSSAKLQLLLLCFPSFVWEQHATVLITVVLFCAIAPSKTVVSHKNFARRPTKPNMILLDTSCNMLKQNLHLG
jgi:hypothetical protein